jgi:hypothetical protein
MTNWQNSMDSVSPNIPARGDASYGIAQCIRIGILFNQNHKKCRYEEQLLPDEATPTGSGKTRIYEPEGPSGGAKAV